MAELSVDIVASANQLVSELSKGATAAKNLENATIQLGKSQIFLSNATGKFFKEFQDGSVIMQKAVSAREELNAVGIQTTAQIQEQITLLTTLRDKYSEDAAVVLQLDKSIETLTQGFQDLLNTSRATLPVFDSMSGAYNQLNRLGITTSRSVERQRQQLERLKVTFKNDAVVVEQLNQRIRALNNTMSRTGRGAGRTSQIFFQFGQAVSDFSVAGIRGAANNLEFLALQLGASGPLILAVTAATVAFIAFEDQIIDAVTGGGAALKELTKDVKDVSDSIIELSKSTKISFSGSLEELEENAIKVGSVVEKLEEKARDLRLELGKQQTSTTGGVTTFVSTSPEIQAIQKDLEAVNNVLSRQKGILESLNGTIEEEKLLREVIADLEDTSLTKNEEAVKKEKEKLNILERIQQKNKDLQRDLDILKSIDQERLGTILRQNQALDRQIKSYQETARIVSFLQELQSRGVDAFRVSDAADFRLGFVLTDKNGKTISFDDAASFLDNLQGKIRAGDLRNTGELSPLNDPDSSAADSQIEALEAIRSGADLTAEAFERAGISAEFFFTQTREGLELAAQLSADAAGNIAGAFADAYEASGEKSKAFFNLSKAFSIAQATISTFEGANKAFAMQGPLGFISGAAIITAGLANVAKIASTRPGGRGGSAAAGGSSAATGPGILDPRQGRGVDDRFVRDTTALGFNESRMPSSLQVNIFGEFNLRGSDLVASVETTQRRQSRTRG